MSSTADCRSLWAKIKLIVLHCIAFEGMLIVDDLQNLALQNQHTCKVKVSYLFLSVAYAEICEEGGLEPKTRLL